ncbi:MAG: hypothetical protein HC921_18025 [Synechococcaceae cyanobacterium SM2_3_1]|nr:hypothetical protein [Synechococcaceae cyanobacterium SM2_3_1]
MKVKSPLHSHPSPTPEPKVDTAWFRSYGLDPLRGKHIEAAGTTPWDIRNPAHS